MIKNSIKVLPGATVCEDTKLRGDIIIGPGTIIHPCVQIIAEAGPIIIGECCLIEEQVKIIHRVAFDQATKTSEGTQPVLHIGSHNVFEVGCQIEANEIGDNNVFESKCFVGNKVSVKNGCVIGAGCQISHVQVLQDNCVVYGKNCTIRQALEPPALQTLQMDTLAKILPNYHHIRKPHKRH